MGHRVASEHVVAVDPDPGNAEPDAAPRDRHAELLVVRLRDRPAVVLAEQHDGGVVDRGEDESLVDVTLRGGAVAEVRHDRGVLGRVARANEAVALDAHRVARRVQGVRANDQGVVLEVVRRRVPATMVDSAEEPKDMGQVKAAGVGDAVLAVGREDVVLGGQRAARADLRGLLT